MNPNGIEFNNQLCDNCMFWDWEVAEDGAGICHRYPPQVVGSLMEHERSNRNNENERGTYNAPIGLILDSSVHPVTVNGDWCGEWSQ